MPDAEVRSYAGKLEGPQKTEPAVTMPDQVTSWIVGNPYLIPFTSGLPVNRSESL